MPAACTPRETHRVTTTVGPRPQASPTAVGEVKATKPKESLSALSVMLDTSRAAISVFLKTRQLSGVFLWIPSDCASTATLVLGILCNRMENASLLGSKKSLGLKNLGFNYFNNSVCLT